MGTDMNNDNVKSVGVEASALFNISYGLYVVTTNDGEKDNGCIVNTVVQVTASPLKVAVTVNKQNYTCETIVKTGVLNVNCLTESAPFSTFERFGFKSGRTADKFGGENLKRSANGLVVLSENVNSFFSLAVEEKIDSGTHITFICSVEEAANLSKGETMTYSYYHKNVKPKPAPKAAKGFICKICGYVYEGETLPPDFVCPWCKHGAADFEPVT